MQGRVRRVGTCHAGAASEQIGRVGGAADGWGQPAAAGWSCVAASAPATAALAAESMPGLQACGPQLLPPPPLAAGG